jgi:hypothetical protein
MSYRELFNIKYNNVKRYLNYIINNISHSLLLGNYSEAKESDLKEKCERDNVIVMDSPRRVQCPRNPLA